MAVVSTLKRKGAYWYCNNCMVRQPGIVPQCIFCEIPFSNYETVLIEEIKKQNTEKILYGTNKDIDRN